MFGPRAAAKGAASAAACCFGGKISNSLAEGYWVAAFIPASAIYWVAIGIVLGLVVAYRVDMHYRNLLAQSHAAVHKSH